MTTQNTKRFMMPLFAFLFFIMLASGARAEGDTVRTWQWQVEYGTTFWGVQYSKTDKYIVATGVNDIYFLDPADGKLIEKIKARTTKTYPTLHGKVAFINGDTEFLLESEDRSTIECYDAATFKVKYSLEAINGEIVDYDVSKDEKSLIAKIDSNSLRLWDLESRKVVAEYNFPFQDKQMKSELTYPQFSPNGRDILVNTYKKIKISETAYPPFYIASDIYNCVVFDYKLDSIGAMLYSRFNAYSNSGKYFASVVPVFAPPYGTPLEIKFYDSDTYKEISTLNAGRSGALANIFFTKDEEHIVISLSSSVDICKVFRIKDGVNTINYVTGSASGAAISVSGNNICFTNQGNVTQYLFTTTSSVENSYFDNGFISYPNPMQGGGVLRFNQEKPGDTKIYISDEKGEILKEICASYFDEGQHCVAINVSDLSNGVYFITVANDTQNFTEKIVVNR